MKVTNYPNSVVKIRVLDFLDETLILIPEEKNHLVTFNYETGFQAVYEPQINFSNEKVHLLRIISPDEYVIYIVGKGLIRINTKNSSEEKITLLGCPSDMCVDKKNNLLFVGYNEETYFNKETWNLSLEVIDLTSGKQVASHSDPDIFDLTSVAVDDAHLFLCGYGEEQLLKAFRLKKDGRTVELVDGFINELPIQDLHQMFKLPSTAQFLLIDKTQQSTSIYIYDEETKINKLLKRTEDSATVLFRNDKLLISNDRLRTFTIYNVQEALDEKGII